MKTDEEIQQDVIAELSWEPELKDVHTQIGVAVKNGVVTLTGAVGAYNKKVAAERSALGVKGVRIVASDIEVKVSPVHHKSDAEIAEAIRSALAWNSSINEDRIKIKVDQGWVILDGEVEWPFQRTAVQKEIEALTCVVGITNNIAIQEKVVDAATLRAQIASAFQRNAALDANAIKVEVAGGKVTLTGSVRTLTEKKEAERVAWSAPGINDVDSRIRIALEVLA